jgi:large subunit ribosomal protein L47
MFRRSVLRNQGSTAFLLEFVDPSFLNKKRPANPGGEWPVDLLQRKSTADLQQIWFSVLKEKNQLMSTKLHYLRHQEDLGAMPGPNRIKLLDTTLKNIKTVVKQRDFEATDAAVKIFKERLAKGIYRYPPGPPPPPGYGVKAATVLIESAAPISELFLRSFLATPTVKDDHGGIVSIVQTLPDDVLEQKRLAEMAWEEYQTAKSDHAAYYMWQGAPSTYDHSEVELAPGLYDGMNEEVGATLPAAEIDVPSPADPPAAAPGSALEKVKLSVAPAVLKEATRFMYFPGNTMAPPPATAPVRPTHPDEIEGPWTTRITFETLELAEKAVEVIGSVINQQEGRMDGVIVTSAKISDDPPLPYASQCPIYQEALREEEASMEVAKNWPHAPVWKSQYDLYSSKNLADVIKHNYSNVVDYVDREVVLTGRSVWESPIEIDHSCGSAKNVPIFAKKPEEFFKQNPLPDVL